MHSEGIMLYTYIMVWFKDYQCLSSSDLHIVVGFKDYNQCRSSSDLHIVVWFKDYNQCRSSSDLHKLSQYVIVALELQIYTRFLCLSYCVPVSHQMAVRGTTRK